MSSAVVKSAPSPAVEPAADLAARPYPTVRLPRRVVAATVAGSALEFYDFLTYAFFAVYIGHAFFPASTPLASLLLSLGAFGVGFVARPLGSLLIGAYADRVGRRPAMLLTIVLITVGTLGFALTPTFAQIGVAAPIIVIVCRLIQGLALGGEVGPSVAFLIEAAPPARRGFYASWQVACQGVAILIAGVIGVLVSALLSADELQAWGWRLPFAVGLVLVPLALYLRIAMPETLQRVQQMDQVDGAGPSPSLLQALRKHTRLIVLAVLVVMGGTVSTYVGSYMTTYAITTLKIEAAMAQRCTVVLGVSVLVFGLLGGWLSDRYGRRAVMLWPRVLLALLIWPAFVWLDVTRSAGVLLLVTVLVASTSSLSASAFIVSIPELFPRQVRATGLSISYALGVTLFGSTTQLILAWLIDRTGSPQSPAWYVVGTSVVTIAATLALPESRGRSLDD